MSKVPLQQWDWIKTATRPDSELPPELRHDEIREVRDVSSTTQRAYQIVFNQSWMPYRYPRDDGEWEIEYARTEWHPKVDGLLGKLLPQDPCITIVVKREKDDYPWFTSNRDGGETGGDK